ncbi:ISNCY family transposase [bacterium]|nr:ISNCY family transposase [bacterium]MBU2461494.1 ISNCY family transposase [bacterium]
MDQSRRFLLTMGEIQRHKVLTELLEGKIKATEVSELLGLSYVHISRLKKKMKECGIEGLLKRSRSSPNMIPEAKAKVIAGLYEDTYYDFNILHFKDKLEENHKIKLSYESTRKILISFGLHHPKKKKKVYRRRRRMPKAGMLVQMDSSQHQWIEDIPTKWWLIAMIDDATSEIPYARFFPSDTVFANMQMIRRFIEIKGLFTALYVDRASHFETTRHGGLHYNVSPEQDETQIERALKELGITIITANSPQAKGRIEVSFRLFQDRLIKEMRLAGIKDYDEANRFLLDKFLPWRNKRYTIEAESSYTPLPHRINLDTIFCKKIERIAANDNTISVNGQVIQIPPNKTRFSFAKAKVTVCILSDDQILVLYKGSIICESMLLKENKTLKKEQKIEELLSHRDYVLVGSKI